MTQLISHPRRVYMSYPIVGTQKISYPQRLEVAYAGLGGWRVGAEISALWSGNIVTVGATGKDYTNPYAAIVGAPSGSLILIDAGSYTLTVGDSLVYKTLLLKGLGSLASDTVISAPISSGGAVINFGIGSNIVLENLELVRGTSYGVAVRVSSSANLTANKCYLYGSSGAAYPFAGMWDTYTGTTIIRNTYLRRGAYDLTGQSGYNLELSKIYLQKVEIITTPLNLLWTHGSLAESDTATAPTPGYGFAYGTDLISQRVAYVSNPREVEIAYEA